MTRIFTFIATVILVMTANAQTFSYRFNSTPLPKAIREIMENHPELDINFIYNELETYKTSAIVKTNDAYDALRQTIGLNPVTVVRSRNTYYLEALQHGKYVYTGKAVGTDHEPVVAATVLLLAPKDSTVITYGITDDAGRFSIPCDRQGVLAKLSCVGYKTSYSHFDSFNVGTILMAERPIKLKTLTIVGEDAWIYSDRSIYIPTVRQKNAANSAITLLGLMAIPQLDVDMGASSVKTLAGQSVAIFIDFNESTPQELDGIKTQDVKRVEVYDFPTDPRFKGAHHIVNLIMQKYEYGGYTKIAGEKQVGVNKTDASLYSKLSYKSMIYDLYADESYLTDRHQGTSQTEIFRFPNLFNVGPQTVERSTSSEGSRFRTNSNNVAVRALFSTSKIKLSNRISLNYNHTPVNDTYNAINYEPEIVNANSSTQQLSSDNLTLGYFSDYLFTISSGLTLQTDLTYIYGNNKSNSVYASGTDFLITNDANEISHDVHVNPKLSFRLNDHNNIMLFGSGVWRRNNIQYFGDSPSFQKYNVQAYFTGLHYDLILAKIQAGGEIGWAWEKNKISGFDSSDNFPQINVYANYMAAPKHLLAFSWNYGKDVPDASQKSPNMLQQNELMWFTGSPSLKDYKYMNTNLTYTWLPNNRWQFTSNVGLFNFDDRCVGIYLPVASDGTMLRKYVNGGNYHTWMFSINATAKFFGNSLVISFMPQYWLYRTSGQYRHIINNLNGRIQTTYYLKNFFFMGSYSLKRKFPATQAEYIEEVPEQYQVRFGWGNGNLNLSVTAYNFFRNSWVGSVQKLQSDYYDFSRIRYSAASHMRISFAATYTLGYGKKVDRYDEVKKGDAAGSAILK